MKIKFYLNENIPTVLADALKRRGYDAITTQSSGKRQSSDIDQILFANRQNRVVLTFNAADFVKLHIELHRKNIDHSGIIVSDQLPIGELLRRLLKFVSSFSAEDMKNRLEYLSNWK